MTRSLSPSPRRGAFPVVIATRFIALALLALLFNPASIGAQSPSTREPRSPVQPALPDRFAVPPRIVVPSGPRAEIDPDRRTVTQGQRAVFNSSSLADPDVPIAAYQWSGPGGQASGSKNFVINTANLEPATYTVTLIVTDRRQRQGRASATLIVQARPRPPVARISPDHREVIQGARVRFSSASYHPDRGRRIVRTRWQTSWGQRGSGNNIDVDTGRLGQGTYRVTLRVYDNREASDSATATLVVQARAVPPVARIDPDRREVIQGERVRFSSTSYHPDRGRRIVRTRWQASWGPEGSGNYIDVATDRLGEGSYTVQLEVYDDQGERDTARAILLVAAPRQLPPVARITPRRHEVRQGEAAEFDGRASTDPDGEIQGWSWRLNERRVGNQSSVRIDTRNLSPGEYRVRLDLWDQQRLSANDEAILVVAERPREIDAAIVELNVSPEEVLPGQEVQIRAVVANQGQATLRDLPIDFYLLRTRIRRVTLPSLEPGESREVNLNWAPKLQGRHIVVAIVNPDDRPVERNRQNNSRRFEVTAVAPPSVTISPSPLEVSQGETAAFTSRIVTPGTLSLGDIDYRWRGPGNRNGRDARFELDTSEIPPGQYEITLEVGDRRGFEASAVSTLIIRSATAEVWLSADSRRPQSGQAVHFSGGIRPEARGIEYQLTFGDGSRTDWMPIPEAAHRYEAPGEYIVRLSARRTGEIIGSSTIDVVVTEVASVVLLRADGEFMRAGEPLRLAAAVEPRVDDVEFQFHFGDGQASDWTRDARVTHTYRNQGAYDAFVIARIAGGSILQSPAVRINLGAATGIPWLWVAAGLATLGAVAAAYWRKTGRAAGKGNFSVVPRLNLDEIGFDTRGNVASGHVIGLRTVRGRPRLDSSASAPILSDGKPRG